MLCHSILCNLFAFIIILPAPSNCFFKIAQIRLNWAQLLKLQERWFSLVTVCNTCITIHNLIRSTKLNGKRAIERRRASITIQRNWRNHHHYRIGLLTRSINSKFPFLFVQIKFNMRAKVRRRKAKIVRWFAMQFTNFTKVNVAVRMYRFRVIKAQRLVRGWLACKGARLDVLCRKWSKR